LSTVYEPVKQSISSVNALLNGYMNDIGLSAYSIRLAAHGGLTSYGVDYIDVGRRAASYVDRVLRGDDPSNLPVQRPTKFELVINV
jgi:ABC-type uncharacterized transport system substrate-binding protein